MKYLKMLGLAAVAAMALTAFLGAGTASATQLYKYTTPSANDKLGVETEITATLEPGSSALLKDTGGSTNDTCTTSEVKGKIEKDTTTGVNPQGNISSLTFGNCSHKTVVIAKGSLEIKNIAGTTNGTVVSKGAEVTVESTIFGISCIARTGTGTSIGTLTGAKSSTAAATMDINGVIPLSGICGDSIWTGSYTVTSPLGLTVEAS